MIEFYAILLLMFVGAMGFVLFPLICPANHGPTAPWLGTILIVFLGIVAFTFYEQWGYTPALRSWMSSSSHARDFSQQIRHLNDLSIFINKVKERMLQRPEDSNGWYLLGLAYLTQDNYSQAQDAFEKAYQLNKNNPLISAHYAKALYLGNHYKMTPRTKELIADSLRHNPNDETSLQLLALDALRQGQYEKAISLWQNILTTLPKKSDRRAEYLLAIQRVKTILRIQAEMKL